jgi:hypothetical protein
VQTTAPTPEAAAVLDPTAAPVTTTAPAASPDATEPAAFESAATLGPRTSRGWYLGRKTTDYSSPTIRA